MGVAEKVWGDYPVYYKQPIRWVRYHAHTKPHFVFSIFFGVSAPLLLLMAPLREKYIFASHNPIPFVYPLPTRDRDATLTGFDDQ
ncbi:hypothetical protein METBIDRAFT_38725 [Metschnikowia bicuspidata var. bicuspidata NRRL YB-4993]|uniref:NADH-ubiquinone oxidoreductase 9.5 kDa subunit n=1 Tax=Metschnikowia bicuspidata var. bicuspidata NRRL YB-4993 TaxID=869754 RepID=A0A1A0HF97_9ASCO|nr:hypothetical protein METBIDRAFT_38725 [Metschnikowia bicuspidata var. bicuspidata NRRL YB-4993]OBA22567.1 hypothetical protein METBIDRAFT_38725 [Metschnikowia bicuspidata var. bicuspidata NRRL YB-4993]